MHAGFSSPPPPRSEWPNCCVVFDEFLSRNVKDIARRRILRRSALHILYMIVLVIVSATTISTSSAFGSNTRFLSDAMHFQTVRVPQRVVVMDYSSQVPVNSFWIGPRVRGADVRSLPDWTVFQLTRTTLESCNGSVALGPDGCIFPIVAEELRSAAYADCGGLQDAVCDSNVFQNCFQADTQRLADVPPTLNATAGAGPLSFNVTVGPNMCGAVHGTRVLELCRTYSQGPWFRSLAPSAFRNQSARNPELNRWAAETTGGVGPRTRMQIFSEAVANPSAGTVKAQSSRLEADLSGGVWASFESSTGYPSRSYSSTSKTYVAVSGLLVAIVLLNILFFFKRILTRPLSVLASISWLVIDCVTLGFQIDFLVLFFQFFVQNTLVAETCQPDRIIDQLTHLIQIMGVLLALSFVEIFKYVTLVPHAAVSWKAAARGILDLGWFALVVLCVYLLCAYAMVVLFGAGSLAYHDLGTSFLGFAFVTAGLDVTSSYFNAATSLPLADPSASVFYLILVFVVARLVAGVVTGIVATSYERTKTANDNEVRIQREVGGDASSSRSAPRARGGPGGGIAACGHRWKMRVLRRLHRWRVVLTLREDEETIFAEVAMDRLRAWRRKPENQHKTFITFDEIGDALCTIDDFTRLLRVSPRQIEYMMSVCGGMHVYTLEDAKQLEKSWEELVRWGKGKVPWTRRTAEQIAVQCKRLASVVQASTTSSPELASQASKRDEGLAVFAMRMEKELESANVSFFRMKHEIENPIGRSFLEQTALRRAWGPGAD